MSREPITTASPRERVLLCGVLLPDHPPEAAGPLEEVRGLAHAAGVDVIGDPITQRRDRAHASSLMGRGKVDEIAAEVKRLCPDAVVVDNDLTPGQVRNLERAFEVRVVDRSELILDIFAKRAQTAQARLQVELAQVEYLLPRLRRMWTHLERQVGGIGTRGPGETQLETDRRLILKRVRDLKARLADIEARKRRQVGTRAERFTVGLVGYTNAGKTTLLNCLTGADELSADMLFATLDTRTRKWELSDGRRCLLSDTVGFLQRLPHHLVASFHATLEEALNVDLLLHVVDASDPDAATHLAAVEDVLQELSRHRHSDVLVLNKVDRVDDPLRLQLLLARWRQEAVYVSAKTGEGLERLDAVVRRRLDARSALIEVSVPVTDGRTVALTRGAGVLEEERCGEERMILRARVGEHALGLLQRQLGPEAVLEILEPPREPLLLAEDEDELEVRKSD